MLSSCLYFPNACPAPFKVGGNSGGNLKVPKFEISDFTEIRAIDPLYSKAKLYSLSPLLFLFRYICTYQETVGLKKSTFISELLLTKC